VLVPTDLAVEGNTVVARIPIDALGGAPSRTWGYQAVVTGADRENFWQLVEAECVAEKMPSVTSLKSLSKRTRWV
jgi:hypothetical protein